MACDSFAAKAKDKITIQSPTETGDIYGGRTISWATQSTPFAYIQPVSGSEVIAQLSSQSRVSHKMTIRYQSALKDISTVSDYRVSFDGRLFGIKAIISYDTDMKSGGKVYQTLFVEENAPDVAG